jgi:hypothetical protein
MQKKRTLLIRPLQNLDDRLLLNNPVMWSTRIHLALYYGILCTIILTIICFIVPDDPRATSQIYNWVVLISILSLLGIIFWLIYLLRFNVFKRFGDYKRGDYVKTFLAHFIIVLVFISWPFIPPVVQSVRANIAYDNEEITRDINDMNLKVCLLARDSVDRQFSSDTFRIDNSLQQMRQRIDPSEVDGGVSYSYHYYLISEHELKQKLSDADSINKISDSEYVIYDSPDYQFVNSYSVSHRLKTKPLSSFELFNRAIKGNPPFDEEKTRNELNRLIAKYKHADNFAFDNFEYPNGNYEQRIRARYGLGNVNTSLSNIDEKKFRWNSLSVTAAMHLAYYLTLTLSLLIFVFRHSTRKTFFLSLLTSVILLILTLVFLLMAQYNGSVGFGDWMAIYFVIFSVLAATIFGSRSRNVFAGIGLNLGLILVPLIPVYCVSLYFDYLRRKHALIYTFGSDDYMTGIEREQFFYTLAEIGGFLLFLVLLFTVIQKAYRKWYASPEQ